VCVIPVLKQWLMMTKGGPPPNDGAEVSKSAVYIYLRSFYGRGAEFDFFFGLNPDVREILIMIRMFSMISKKIESFFRLYPIYHRSAIHIAGVGPSRIDDTKIQKRCEPASSRCRR
jgi:hypothetical protein